MARDLRSPPQRTRRLALAPAERVGPVRHTLKHLRSLGAGRMWRVDASGMETAAVNLDKVRDQADLLGHIPRNSRTSTCRRLEASPCTNASPGRQDPTVNTATRASERRRCTMLFARELRIERMFDSVPSTASLPRAGSQPGRVAYATR